MTAEMRKKKMDRVGDPILFILSLRRVYYMQ